MVIRNTKKETAYMSALIGIDSIKPYVGNVSDATILKWKSEYPSFPIKKLKGQWVSESGELENWFKLFCTERLEEL